MAVGFSNTNKPLNPRGQDASPKGYNRASLFSGKALDFDGVNDEVLSTITISGAKTYCAWINADTTANERIISIAGGGYSNITFSNNKFGMYDGTNIPETTTTFETGEWYFVVSVQEANNAKIYVNGISQPLNTTNWIERTHTGATLAIGRDGGGATAWYDGEISGVRVFNTALTAEQVADLYNNPEKVVPTGVDNTALKLWLPMMEGAGTTAYDGSGNGNHGTIAGATYVNGIGAPVAQSAVMDWNKGVNYLEHTESIATSGYWYESVTINGGQLDPIGGTNAVEWVSTNTTNHQLFNGVSIAGNCVLSCYVKSDEPCAYLGAHNNGFSVYFDLTTQTISATNGSGVSGEIEAFGDWYRIIAYFPAINNEIQIGFLDAVYTGTSGGPWGVPTAIGTSGFIAFPSLIASTTKGPYIPNHTGTPITTPVLLPQGLTTGRDITGVNLFENVRKQGALNLDGNSWAEVHDNESLDMTTNITAESWVYWRQTSGSTDSGILARWTSATGRQFLIYHQNDATVKFYTNTAASEFSSMTEGWHHIVGTYDGVNRKLYVDGVLRDSDAYSAAMESSDAPVEIGRYFHGDPFTTEDTIAQPRIYNRALTAAEVLQNYNSGKNTYK